MITITAIFLWIAFGIVAGGIARFLIPGRQPMGWLATMSLGIMGSFIGGFFAFLLDGGDPFPSVLPDSSCPSWAQSLSCLLQAAITAALDQSDARKDLQSL